MCIYIYISFARRTIYILKNDLEFFARSTDFHSAITALLVPFQGFEHAIHIHTNTKYIIPHFKSYICKLLQSNVSSSYDI